MGRKLIWIAAALVLIAIPAVIGLVALGDDDSSSSARRAGALVAPGGTTAYQLQLTQAVAGTPAIKEAIVVDSFSWGAENPTTIGSATGGAGAGKIKFNELHIKKKVDRASPLLFKQMATGAHYKTAILTVRKAGEKEPYMTFTMDTVFVSNQNYGGGSPEVVDEEITFVFGKVGVQSSERSADGTLATPVTSGWDQVTNVNWQVQP
jgi:type VI secretion system secreted protein Hcp